MTNAVLHWFECPICGYDSAEAGMLTDGRTNAICPLCAGDCGHDNKLSTRPATDTEMEAWHKAALARVEILMEMDELPTFESSQLDDLVDQVEAYEEKKFPMT